MPWYGTGASTRGRLRLNAATARLSWLRQWSTNGRSRRRRNVLNVPLGPASAATATRSTSAEPSADFVSSATEVIPTPRGVPGVSESSQPDERLETAVQEAQQRLPGRLIV